MRFSHLLANPRPVTYAFFSSASIRTFVPPDPCRGQLRMRFSHLLANPRLDLIMDGGVTLCTWTRDSTAMAGHGEAHARAPDQPENVQAASCSLMQVS
jgi:hypothetical protein